MDPKQLQEIVTQAVSECSTIEWWTYLLILLIALIGSFIGAYLKKKGENYASKEDISDITSKIESVKTEYLKESEKFKTELNKELELLKISHTLLETNKVQFFSELIEHINESIIDFQQTKKTPNKEKQKKYHKKTTSLFAKLFLFASDDTIKKWIEIRKVPKEESYQKALLMMFTDFILSLRKDIGYKDTECNLEDVMHFLYRPSDWNKFK